MNRLKDYVKKNHASLFRKQHRGGKKKRKYSPPWTPQEDAALLRAAGGGGDDGAGGAGTGEGDDEAAADFLRFAVGKRVGRDAVAPETRLHEAMVAHRVDKSGWLLKTGHTTGAGGWKPCRPAVETRPSATWDGGRHPASATLWRPMARLRTLQSAAGAAWTPAVASAARLRLRLALFSYWSTGTAGRRASLC